MTQQIAEAPEPYSTEEVRAAESAEQASLSDMQHQYLTKRVVSLRAHINRLEGLVEELRAENARLNATE